MRLLSIQGISFEIAFDYAVTVAGGIVLLCALVLLYIRKLRIDLRKLSSVQRQLDKIRSQPNFDQKMTVVLEELGGQFSALTYAFYIRDERFDKFMLRATRFRSGSGPGASTQSALISSPADAYQPAMTASNLFLTSKIEVVKEGEVPLLVLPISGKGMIRIGPIHRVSRREKRRLKRWMDFVRPMVEEMIEAEQVKEQSNIAMASKNAIVNISKIALEVDVALETVLPFCVNTLKFSGGCLVHAAGGEYRVIGKTGPFKELADRLETDEETLFAYRALSEQEAVHYVREPIPSYFQEEGIKQVLLVSTGPHYFVFWNKAEKEKRWISLYFETLVENYSRFAAEQGAYLRGTGAYVPLLQALARLLDDLSPNTIGYSELLSRYSIVIAREMGLSTGEIRDVAIAAYLAHIGTIALSSDLFQKEGQYTDAEFELMKLHAEVSALIVSFATGNERAASYIRHHHERMDGNGYPAGLKGAEIPAGARIIAVVQTFLAKINGRNYRDPMSFNQSLQTLRSASGQQLDADMVNVFIDWYQDKRRSQIDAKKALGACSEMCCVPETICRTCPAYGRTDKNCWETEGVLCAAHGKTCDSCFVKTEYVSRKSVSVV
ncbi:HD domain-containing phosphohydrolase [Paenibacillus sp.]|uniref:HD-GYP domain-containing protein n=1 Tax=Paenibacillus sp. TaxID=58172 RepID=UPI002810E66F|nr:HD domain-containing phosphohydrolase [Paenibacillus sp.]